MTDDLRSKKITEIFNDSARMAKIVQAGINDALLQHKRMGNPICEWRNGQIVWIPAEKISVQDIDQ